MLFLPILLSLSGPDGVKIENADGAVATVTGLQVGTYGFTLTVTDDRDLQSSDTVSVIVREGVCVCVCVRMCVCVCTCVRACNGGLFTHLKLASF